MLCRFTTYNRHLLDNSKWFRKHQKNTKLTTSNLPFFRGRPIGISMNSKFLFIVRELFFDSSTAGPMLCYVQCIMQSVCFYNQRSRGNHACEKIRHFFFFCLTDRRLQVNMNRKILRSAILTYFSGSKGMGEHDSLT